MPWNEVAGVLRTAMALEQTLQQIAGLRDDAQPGGDGGNTHGSIEMSGEYGRGNPSGDGTDQTPDGTGPRFTG